MSSDLDAEEPEPVALSYTRPILPPGWLSYNYETNASELSPRLASTHLLRYAHAHIQDVRVSTHTYARARQHANAHAHERTHRTGALQLYT